MSDNAPESLENELSDNKDESYVALFVNVSLLCFHYSFHKDPKWKTNESTTLSCPLNQSSLKIVREHAFPCIFQKQPNTYVKYREGQRHPDRMSI